MSLERIADRIREFASIDAPVGFEETVLRAVRDGLAAVCDAVEVDVRGNVYGRQVGAEDGPVVMVTAHADEIGFLVTSLLPGGFLRFAKLGHPTDMVLPGQRVRVHGADGPLEGVVGVKPGHVLSGDEARRVPAVNQLYVDVGAGSADEVAAWGVEVGTPITFVGEMTATRNPNVFFGKAVDDRIGVVSVLEVAERLAKESVAANVVYAIVVEEEIGLRGAAVAAKRIEPDVMLAIDTVPAGGTPDLRPDELPWEIGKGPLLKVRETRGLSTHGPLRRFVRETADRLGIPYQLIVDTAGVTDATSAQQASGDVAAMVVGLARRYSHSAVEMFDVRDVRRIVDLVAGTVSGLESVEPLRRF